MLPQGAKPCILPRCHVSAVALATLVASANNPWLAPASAAAIATAATAARFAGRTTRPASRTTTPLPLTLALLGKAVGTDIPECCLHRIGLRLRRLAVGAFAGVVIADRPIAVAIASAGVALVRARAPWQVTGTFRSTTGPACATTAAPLAVATRQATAVSTTILSR